MNRFLEDLLGGLILGGAFYATDRLARQSERSKIEQQSKDDIRDWELAKLRKELDELKKSRG